MFARIEDVKNQRCSLDEFFCEQLTYRLENLKSRTNTIIRGTCSAPPTTWEDFVTSLVDQAPVIPSDLDLFQRQFMRGEDETAREINQAAFNATIRTWEFSQLLIKHTFQELPAGEMSVKTRRMLQLSPSLWSLLQNQTYELGHPDQAGGYGSFLWIIDCFAQNSQELSLPNAITGYKESIVESQKHFTDTSLQALYTRTILPRMDGELYRAYTDRSIPVKFPELMLGGKGRTVTLTLTPLEAETWGDPLQRPDFLFKVKSEPETAPILVPLPSARQQTASAVKARDRETTSASSSTEKGEILLAPAVTPLLSTTLEEASQHPLSPVQGTNEPTIFIPPEKAAAAEAGPIQRGHAEEFVWPRGIRLSRPDIVAKPIIPVAAPDKRVQQFVNDLFDGRHVSHITFSDFEKHWTRIGGRVEGNRGGGSHRHLIAPDGTSLWGTFDHGGFGKQTIGYLQAAFWSQGYRPTSTLD
jgi:hypothetical protein